jgi:hypothetical protein
MAGRTKPDGDLQNLSCSNELFFFFVLVCWSLYFYYCYTLLLSICNDQSFSRT